ncbi:MULTISPECIES: membrane protein [Streptomyces]|uniref:membrane protein n=1 Tax=Streptomyces TaxID=1883 RepID=UPI0004BD1589|nr:MULTISPECIES: membrane protein [Streptomyces]KOV73416.1 membrane protein [Streptomyces sp. NRRL WC-3723]
MAQAAPTPGGMSRPGRTPEAERRSSDVVRRAPDVFDARTHAVGRLAVPVVLGLIYGYWVAANNRFGGPITGWNVLLGLVSALVFAVLCAALLVLAPRMPREVHALLWTAFVGCAFGFLYNQSGSFLPTQSGSQGGDVLRSVLMSLLVSAATFAVFFYRYYTREDASGRRIR